MRFARCYSCMRTIEAPGKVCPHCGYDNTEGPKSQPPHALPCGTVLYGRYVLGKVLGEGGFGITYMAYNLALDQPVCIKEYFPAGAAMRSAAHSSTVQWSGSADAQKLRQGRESFVREARKAVKLRDLDAVVKAWDVFYENETAYIVMNYIEGETLKSLLAKRGSPMSEQECIALLSPVIDALGKVHERGIIHRDISPDNLMLQTNGKLILLDMGAAKDLTGGNSGQSSFIVAKQGFSPLEQYRHNGQIGPWTDVYAMCATICYCVTGRLIPAPLERLSGEKIDFSAFSAPVAAALEKGLALKTEERLQSMPELKAMLLASAPPKEEDIKEPEKKDPGKKRRVPLFLGTALVVAAIAFGAVKGIDRAAHGPDPTAAPVTAAPVQDTESPYFTPAPEQMEPEPTAVVTAEPETLQPAATEPPVIATEPAVDVLPEAQPTEPAAPASEPETDQSPEAQPTEPPVTVSEPATDLSPEAQAYAEAEELLRQKRPGAAALAFRALGTYADAAERSSDAWKQAVVHNHICGAEKFSLGVRADGSVIRTGSSLSFMENVVAVAAGGEHSVYLLADGRVTASGKNYHGETEVGDWTDIVSIAAGPDHTVGLRADGTVVAAGQSAFGRCEVSDWTDIVAIAAGEMHTVGLRADGTVVAVGMNSNGQCEVSDWKDIVAICAGSWHTIGVRADGKCVAAGWNEVQQCEVSDWSDVVMACAGEYNSVGLRADGTCVACGWNKHQEFDEIRKWNGIKEICAGPDHFLGLRGDGTCVGIGHNEDAQCAVGDWTEIGIGNLQ